MQIQTPRLLLRPLQASDGVALAQAMDESWADLSRWMRWATDREKSTDAAHATAHGKSRARAFAAGEDYVFVGVLPEDGDFVLSLRLAPMARDGMYEFCGYWFAAVTKGMVI